jgi:hypothetical protein
MNDGEPRELPGMLAVAYGTIRQQWPHTVDAKVWAEKWSEALAVNPNLPTDNDAMIGWFANAIMAGYDTARCVTKKAG